jgi:hypothetical protein
MNRWPTEPVQPRTPGAISKIHQAIAGSIAFELGASKLNLISL